ncbi:MAG TPA: L-rhamnose mutarotase, partial [Albitalea sp.]|nr:L-rhamnose mutarotase [Albitalea sp.]
MQRMGMVIGIEPDRIAEYKRLHAAVWPAVLARLAASHIRNYSIFLREPENLLFGCWEYHGNDYEADMAAIAADAETRRWWTFCAPCQRP